MRKTGEHPIQTIMQEAIEKIKQSVDVNTVIGDSISTVDGSTIIPITKVSVGFVAGGGEYTASNMTPKNAEKEFPFAGGSGAGYSINPIGFIIANTKGVKYISIDNKSAYEQIFTIIKDVADKITN